jgi:hypothetical protein
MGEEKITRTITKKYVNVGTEENPEWELLNNPFNDVQIFETRWEKVKRFFKKLLHLDKQK